ncbi:MAG: ABC transporter permease [Alphaproteobacteria bacterium]|nr:ABC transporter permease [Alphaproteobacteria bacterium]MBU1561249.1 ABC transporter permease [Alphaproteobacteria bacterium]MBU2302911.1 ABC transporter permease [Alphaproteobacteria bacterium]MBU2370345.1 ABC transporter permease [Alphaproteobacteria bacterium]
MSGVELSLQMPALRRHGWLTRIWKSRPPLVIGLCLGWLALVILAALFAEFLAPFSFAEQSLLKRLKPPSVIGGPAENLFGTDDLGRDVFSRVIYAMRTSILIAIMATVIGATVGTVLGIIAAHFRGWVDDIIMMLVDFQASVPFLIVALAVLAFFGNNFLLLIILIGLFGWDGYARIARGLVLSTNGQGYAFAIRTLGVHPAKVYLRHVLPNMLGVIMVQITLNFPEIILLETSLSFLGLGVQPPGTSLGLLLGEGRNYLTTAWWMGIPAGVVIFLTTLAISLVGDWLRDTLDPNLGGKGE